ncbi:MAG TPA: acyl carrier protein [Bryobacteraceae bacterium]|nr:acyl carrier protein [Bryobacteraceae bacterium]
MTESENKILEIVRQLSQNPEVNVTIEQSLFESGVLDSFGLPDLVSELERAFGVAIPDSDLMPRNFASIRGIDQYVSAKLR